MNQVSYAQLYIWDEAVLTLFFYIISWWSDQQVSGGTSLNVFGSCKHRPHFGHKILSDFTLHWRHNRWRDLAIFFLRNSPGAFLAGFPALHRRDTIWMHRIFVCGWFAWWHSWWRRPSSGLSTWSRPPLLLFFMGTFGSCTFPTISRTITNAISCRNTPFLSPPFWCVSSPPRWPWSWPKWEKTSKSLLFVTYVICTAIFYFSGTVLSPKANVSPFIFLSYTNVGYLFSKTCHLHKNFLPTPQTQDVVIHCFSVPTVGKKNSFFSSIMC